MDSQAVAAHPEGGVLTLRLARPEARNALTDEMAARLRDELERAPQSYGLVKRSLMIAASADIASAMAVETLGQSLLIGSEDHEEGKRALRERRGPDFRGR
jgi:enoyl-CoA hydratase/carnithine racemase